MLPPPPARLDAAYELMKIISSAERSKTFPLTRLVPGSHHKIQTHRSSARRLLIACAFSSLCTFSFPLSSSISSPVKVATAAKPAMTVWTVMAVITVTDSREKRGGKNSDSPNFTRKVFSGKYWKAFCIHVVRCRLLTPPQRVGCGLTHIHFVPGGL